MDYNELEPKIVFQYFKEISNIPHGSGNTEEISKYLMNFAKEHNLKAIYAVRSPLLGESLFIFFSCRY